MTLVRLGILDFGTRPPKNKQLHHLHRQQRVFDNECLTTSVDESHFTIMWSFGALVLASITVASITAASITTADALVYTFDQTSPSQSTSKSTISAENTRLFLAQRLGLSQFHSLENADDDTLRLLDDYGGSQTPLFKSNDRHVRRLLVIIEGLEDPASMWTVLHVSTVYTLTHPRHVRGKP